MVVKEKQHRGIVVVLTIIPDSFKFENAVMDSGDSACECELGPGTMSMSMGVRQTYVLTGVEPGTSGMVELTAALCRWADNPELSFTMEDSCKVMACVRSAFESRG